MSKYILIAKIVFVKYILPILLINILLYVFSAGDGNFVSEISIHYCLSITFLDVINTFYFVI